MAPWGMSHITFPHGQRKYVLNWAENPEPLSPGLRNSQFSMKHVLGQSPGVFMGSLQVTGFTQLWILVKSGITPPPPAHRHTAHTGSDITQSHSDTKNMCSRNVNETSMRIFC